MEARGFVEAAHELGRLGFVLTVVIFQVVFNHIVITKHQDHLLPSASLYRVLGFGCAKAVCADPAPWTVQSETREHTH